MNPESIGLSVSPQFRHDSMMAQKKAPQANRLQGFVIDSGNPAYSRGRIAPVRPL